jgi:HEPN domain-containing protein
MDKLEIIDYWIKTAEDDYKTMINLYNSGDYTWSLFIGHLVIEKILKATYIKNADENPPKTHDLLRLAEKAKLELNEEKEDLLDLITTFNINARYPDYKRSFRERCTREFTEDSINRIKELKIWLMSILTNQ